MKTARVFAALCGALLAAGIVVAGAVRAAALLSSARPPEAAGEKRFRGWAFRDPPLVGRLEEAVGPLETGRAVVPVCVPECETGWFGVMAAYGMPRQAVIDAKTQGQLDAVSVFPTRIVRTRADVRVEPRSGFDGRR